VLVVAVVALLLWTVPLAPVGPASVLAITLVVCPVVIGGLLCFRYLRIKNTTYRLSPRKLECQSYSLKLFGVFNSVVNIAELREIHAYSNSYLDIWFFNCGGVVLTVSGDVPDFRIENVESPLSVKRQIEAICFGGDEVPEVPEGPPPVG
jgi:hypothetical protein